MPTRYEELRAAVATLAAPADQHAAFLDQLFAPLTGGGSAASYPNDELALSLDDLFFAANDMISHGELTQDEAAHIRPLYDLLTALSGERNAAFWAREALQNDARWNDVRALARNALIGLPDVQRAVGRCALNVR